MTNSSGSWKPQVFISFRGKAQRKNLVSSLKSKLEEISDINVYIDENEVRGRSITTLFERIRESSVALVIFSNTYPESCWCLDELVEIKKQMDIGSLVPFPIFYKVDPDCVKRQTGYFLNTLIKTEDYVRQEVNRKSSKSILETEARIWGWRQALVSVCGRMGSTHQHKDDEIFLKYIVDEVKKMILDIHSSPRNDISIIERPPMHPLEAVTSLLQALKLKKSDLEDLIPKPSIHINDVVSLSSDHLVFLDLISLKNPIITQRLFEPVQAGKILLVLLGSLEYFNKGFAFKPRFLPKKTQMLPGYREVVANSYQTGESNDNLCNGEDNNSNVALTCFSFLCNTLKRYIMIIRPPPRRVFISFGEKHLRKNVVSSLKRDLESDQILVDVADERKGRIKESGVAIVVFSAKYPISENCLDELVEIKKLMDAGEIDPFPVFYNVKAESVKEMKGWFRNRLLKIEDQVRQSVKRRDDRSILDTEDKIWRWRQAILSIALRPGLSYEHRTDDEFFSDIVTKVKELFAFRERQMNPFSNITSNLVVDTPLMYRQETEAATTAVVKSLDDDLLYSPTSFLQVLNLKITDLEGFTEISNGLVSLSLKGHTNLVFLKLSSHENLEQFQRSDSFKVLIEGFALNPSGVIRFEEPSLALALESNKCEKWSDMPTTLNNNIL